MRFLSAIFFVPPLIGLLLCIVAGSNLSCGVPAERMHAFSGHTMGSIRYHIRYLAEKEVLTQAYTDSLLLSFNQVFSTYVPTSEISRFNDSKGLPLRHAWWDSLLSQSRWAYRFSSGAFDPTVGPLVEAWGFGPSGVPSADTANIAEIQTYLGMDKLYLTDKGLGKKDPRLRLDLGAVAKGYAVDVLAECLARAQVRNYFVEIGGEVRLSGSANKNRAWRVGIQDPQVPEKNHPAAILSLPDSLLPLGVATSGNYRNQRRVKEKIYVHTLDPKSGRPVVRRLLSATLIAPTAAKADALATACLVMGLAQAVKQIEDHPHLEALFFFFEEQRPRSIAAYATPKIRPYLSALTYPLINRTELPTKP